MLIIDTNENELNTEEIESSEVNFEEMTAEAILNLYNEYN